MIISRRPVPLPLLLIGLAVIAAALLLIPWVVQDQSQEVTPTADATGSNPPAKPTNLQASAEHDSVTLTWTASTQRPEPEPAPIDGVGSLYGDEPWRRGETAQGGSTGATGSESVPREGIYTWRDGDRVMQVQLVSGMPLGSKSVGSLGKRGAAPGADATEADPVFRSEPGGNLMTLPGGVLLVLDSSWTPSKVGEFFAGNGIDSSRVSELGFLENAYLVETNPGFPSLLLANALAAQEGVVISSPNWRTEIEIYQGTPNPTDTDMEQAEDHGDSTDTATDLPLNTSVHGVIGEEGDEDFFKIVIPESTLVEIQHPPYPVSGDARDNRRVTILNSDGTEWSWRWGDGTDFLHRVRLAAGTYYLKVFNKTYFDDADGYDLHVKTIADHPDTINSATQIEMDDPTDTSSHKPGRVIGDFHSFTDVDVFRLELTQRKEIYFFLATIGLLGHNNPEKGSYSTVTLEVLDSGGKALRRPLLGYNKGTAQYSLEAGTYYVRLSPYPFLGDSPPADEDTLVPYVLRVKENVEYIKFLEDCAAIDSDYDDPLYGCQSYLHRIDVAGAWEVSKGEGVNVAVVDTAGAFEHEDLLDNVDASRNHSYVESVVEWDPRAHRARHGIAVAGIIAARDNSVGVRGVAPRATIYGYNLSFDGTLSNTLDALTRNRDVTGVSNNSWGFRNSRGAGTVSSLWTAALESGVNEGYGGKGVFYVFSAGNRHESGQVVGINESKNSYAQTTVCAVDADGRRAAYSETGYTLWICAPEAKVTTDNWSSYADWFGGTSSTAPVVSGVAALVRSANTSLTWRDVKLIIAESATKNDPSNAGWETGAATYASETGHYHYNPEYGFGLVNAGAAVELASNWTNLPTMLDSANTVSMPWPQNRIPDATEGTEPTPLTSRLSLSSDVNFTEFVEVNINFQHGSFRDLEVTLESPSGTVSALTVPRDEKGFLSTGAYTTIRLGSARHLGEDPNGEWTLTVTDHYPDDSGSLNWWGITVYGHGGGVPNRPSGVNVSSGSGELAASWNAPSDGTTPTSYKVRWKESSASWSAQGSVSEDTVSATSAPAHTITGLTDGTEYTVQVIGTNAAGDSAPSAEVTITAGSSPATGTPTISGTVRVGHRLFAGTSGISDTDGMSSSTFAYQWISSDGGTNTDIPGATDRIFTLESLEQGKTIKVRVSFTDDAGYPEVVTSAATTVVAKPLGICGRTKQVREKIVRKTSGVSRCDDITDEHLRQIATMQVDAGAISLQSIDFKGLTELTRLTLYVDVVSLPDDVFDDIASLEKLFISSDYLISLPGGVFDSLVNLERLSLSYNSELTFLPVDAFDSLSDLRELHLSSNDLNSLRAGMFSSLSRLQTLDLMFNDLHELPDGLFNGLTSLNILRMSRNPGAPFTITANVEQLDEQHVIVKVDKGAPFDMRVTLSAQGGTLSPSTIIIDGGTSTSSPVMVRADGESPVSVTVASAALVSGTQGSITTAVGDTLVMRNVPNTPSTEKVGLTLRWEETSVHANEDGGSVTLKTIVTTDSDEALPSDFSFDATVTTDDGTATDPDDYAPSSGSTLTFDQSDFERVMTSSGYRYQATRDYTFTISDDAVDEDDETFTATLAFVDSSNPNFETRNAVATVTIGDDEQVGVTLGWNPATVSVNESSSTARLTATATTTSDMRPETGFTFDATVVTSPGTAYDTDDYTHASTTVTFNQADFGAVTVDGNRRYRASKSVTVPIVNDTDDERDETFTVTVDYVDSNPSHLQGGSAAATVTIQDNDLPTVSIAAVDTSAAEDDTLEFRLTRVGVPDDALTVNVRVSETRRILASGQPTTATFSAGSSTATLDIALNDDTEDEDNSTVTVALRSGSGYVLGTDTSDTATALDNDHVPVTLGWAVDPVTVAEGAGPGCVEGVATTTKDKQPESGFSFVAEVTFADGTAGSGDYTGRTQRQTFSQSDFTDSGQNYRRPKNSR